MPIYESQAWALLALPGVTGHNCPPWGDPLEISHSLLLPSVNSGPWRVKMNQSRATGGWQGELHEAIPEITSVYGAGLCRNLPAPGVVFLGETSASPSSAEMKAALSWPLSSAARRQWVGDPSGPPHCRGRGGDEFPGMSFQLSSAAGIGAAAIISVTACLATPGAEASHPRSLHGAAEAVGIPQELPGATGTGPSVMGTAPVCATGTGPRCVTGTAPG